MSVAYTKNGNGAMNRNNSTMKRTEIKQAITLLWISVLYISCQSPKVIPDFYEAINCDYQKVKIAIKDFLKRIKFVDFYKYLPSKFHNIFRRHLVSFHR